MPSGVRIDWTAVPDLGTAPDEVIARRLHVSVERVARIRCERIGVRKATGRAGIDWSTADLGAEPDSEIARRLAVSRQAVTRAREHRGIPAPRTRRVVLDLPADVYAAARAKHPQMPPHRAVAHVVIDAVGARARP